MLHLCLPWQMEEFHPGAHDRVYRLLGMPIHYSWNYGQIAYGKDTYHPMLWQCKLGAAMTQAIAAAQANHLGAHVWLLGNEPERPDQSNTAPGDFVDAAVTWQALVGGPWAAPGALWGDEGRAWLTEYLRLDGPIPSIWAIHIYGSGDSRGWNDQYRHAQRWLAERSVSRPIWVTETNAAGGYDAQAALLHHLALRPDVTAFWYCAHDPFRTMAAADLVNETGTQRTPLGDLYASLQGVGGAGRNEHNVYMPVARGYG